MCLVEFWFHCFICYGSACQPIPDKSKTHVSQKMPVPTTVPLQQFGNSTYVNRIALRKDESLIRTSITGADVDAPCPMVVKGLNANYEIERCVVVFAARIKEGNILMTDGRCNVVN